VKIYLYSPSVSSWRGAQLKKHKDNFFTFRYPNILRHVLFRQKCSIHFLFLSIAHDTYQSPALNYSVNTTSVVRIVMLFCYNDNSLTRSLVELPTVACFHSPGYKTVIVM